MNWKLIFQLSLFGLGMGIATVYFIPSNIEPFCWLVIFIFCAYVLAKNLDSRYFAHGLMVSLVNSVWITGAHILLFNSYKANHAQEAQMMESMPLSPMVMMLCTGPIVGLISGVILGLFAFAASKMVKR